MIAVCLCQAAQGLIETAKRSEWVVIKVARAAIGFCCRGFLPFGLKQAPEPEIRFGMVAFQSEGRAQGPDAVLKPILEQPPPAFAVKLLPAMK